MKNKYLAFFLILVLAAPILGSFYSSIEKERGKKGTVLVFMMDEEEHEEEEKWEKESGKEKRCHFFNSSFTLPYKIQQSIGYIYLTSKVLLPYTNLITPPPKVS